MKPQNIEGSIEQILHVLLAAVGEEDIFSDFNQETDLSQTAPARGEYSSDSVNGEPASVSKNEEQTQEDIPEIQEVQKHAQQEIIEVADVVTGLDLQDSYDDYVANLLVENSSKNFFSTSIQTVDVEMREEHDNFASSLNSSHLGKTIHTFSHRTISDTSSQNSSMRESQEDEYRPIPRVQEDSDSGGGGLAQPSIGDPSDRFEPTIILTSIYDGLSTNRLGIISDDQFIV